MDKFVVAIVAVLFAMIIWNEILNESQRKIIEDSFTRRVNEILSNYRGQPNQLAKELEIAFSKHMPPGSYTLQKSEIEFAMVKIAKTAFLHEYINKSSETIKTSIA